MGEVVPLPRPRARVDRQALEGAMLRAERILPYLRRHLRELAESPTKLHIDQVRASVDTLREAMDYICYTLVKLQTKGPLP